MYLIIVGNEEKCKALVMHEDR